MSRLLWFLLGGITSAVGIGVAARLMDDDSGEREVSHLETGDQEEEGGEICEVEGEEPIEEIQADKDGKEPGDS